MTEIRADLGVLFIAGFGPITRNPAESNAFYQRQLGLPLKPMAGNETYLTCDEDALPGAKHFALWPLDQAALSCFNLPHWPSSHAVPQGWIEYEVECVSSATEKLVQQGYPLLVASRLEPWGQHVSRLLSPEGLLIGLTYTPWLRQTAPLAE